MGQPSHAAVAAYLRRSIAEGRDSAPIGSVLHISRGRPATGEDGPEGSVD